jgi:hypothetical protein
VKSLCRYAARGACQVALEMKLRHATTLALVGWYLMSPPVMRIPRRGSIVNHTAHLRYWKIRGSYESFGECEGAKGAMLKSAAENPAKMPEDFIDISPTVLGEVTESLVCIASDDPRL